jgi:DNA ligase-1
VKRFPMLYKKTSTGADQMWEIRVDGNKIITLFGQVNGKIQETPPTVCEGKNIGRANETTPEEQALLEAESQWTRKLKKDYVTTLGAAVAGASSDLIEGGILPMLAHKFSEHGDKLKYPCYVQPKLDGHRCLAVVDGKG